MKFNHTNTMKDDDKPEAPEGYTVMLGRDVPDRTGILRRGIGGNHWVEYDEKDERFTFGAYYWYAVPNTKEDDQRPKAPEGYTVMLGKEVPSPVPRGVQVIWWDNKTWLPTNRIVADLWYAVPNDPACTVIRDMATKEKWNADPKASQAIQKPQLQLIPPALNTETAKALMRGAEKYGFFNWRENKVEMMTYLGAMKRHIDHIIDGDHEGDIDPDTGAHHLGCVAAGCGIVLDARKHGTLVDNRPPKEQTP